MSFFHNKLQKYDKDGTTGGTQGRKCFVVSEKEAAYHHNTKETLNCCEKKEDPTLPAPKK